MSTTTKTCDGCDKPLGPFDGGYDVCMPCTRARHASVMARGACKCGRAKRPLAPVEVGGYLVGGIRRGARIIQKCQRCLGNVK